MSCLQVESVTYAYKNGPQVLKGIDVSFERGKVYALVGPSGCGKTTLLSLIGGLDKPASGVIQIEGQNIKQSRPPVKRVACSEPIRLFYWPSLKAH